MSRVLCRRGLVGGRREPAAWRLRLRWARRRTLARYGGYGKAAHGRRANHRRGAYRFGSSQGRCSRCGQTRTRLQKTKAVERHANVTADAATAESTEATAGTGVVAMAGRRQGMAWSRVVCTLPCRQADGEGGTVGVHAYYPATASRLTQASTRVPE